jgi:hypothetical protein
MNYSTSSLQTIIDLERTSSYVNMAKYEQNETDKQVSFIMFLSMSNHILSPSVIGLQKAEISERQN